MDALALLQQAVAASAADGLRGLAEALEAGPEQPPPVELVRRVRGDLDALVLLDRAA